LFIAADPAIALVQLTKGFHAIIDREDAEVVGKRNWQASTWSKSRTNYAQSSKAPRVKLHRFLWDLWGNEATPEVDHRNGDGLDCRRSNLRAATHAENMRNRRVSSLNKTGFRGVCFDRQSGKFVAQIVVDGRRVRYQHCDTAEQASRFYDDWPRELHGEFSSLNRGADSTNQ
jgi:hypothetical protein